MKVAELKANSSVEEIVWEIGEKKGERKVATWRGNARVCNAIGRDDDGNEIKITLWNDEIDMVNEGDTIKIKNGWVKEWNNELQISTGRNGELQKI